MGRQDFAAEHFRTVLGYVPTAVTVITSNAMGAPVGVTIGSFESISLAPPMVGFFAMNSSRTCKTIVRAGSFCVNVLRDSQTGLCWRFARADEHNPFDDLVWQPSPVSNCPILAGTLAWIDCSIDRTVPIGDHHLVVGSVNALDHDGDMPEPLVFCRSSLGRFVSDIAP